MKIPSRFVRLAVAFALCALPAGSAGAEPPIVVCLPAGSACAAVDVTPTGCEGTPCYGIRAGAGGCVSGDDVCVSGDLHACPPGGCADVRAAGHVCPAREVLETCVVVDPLGGIERAATGTITIHEDSSGVTTTLTGVFDQTLGLFSCTTSAPPGTQRTVRCVPLSNSYDWFCGGWIVTATTHIYNAQVAGQASCADFQGFPGQSNYQTLWTNFACCNGTETANAANLAWFVQGAITCQAWGYSAGPEPMGEYTVTCNEPGGYVRVQR